MKNRSPLAVFCLYIITCGIYAFVWFVKTKNEMNTRGAVIPTAWLLIVPLVNIYWMWVYSAGVVKVTGGTQSPLGGFCLRSFLGPIGCAITQSSFNKVAAA
jgi:hypothetical protein